MSYDLTTAPDGTVRPLGTKTYQYNATKERWDRVPSTSTELLADIEITYDGKPNNYLASQYARANVSWNQDVTSFSTSSVLFNFGNGTIYLNTITQFTPREYEFLFQFTGAVGQFQLVKDSVKSTLTNKGNPLIYSPAIAGSYRPSPILSVVPRYSNIPVYSIQDRYFPGILRYFSTNLGSSAAADVRIKSTLQNLINVTVASYAAADIKQSPTGGFNLANMYDSPISTITASSYDVNRYTDFYATNPATTNKNVRLLVNTSAYIDGISPNDASSPIYFASIPGNPVIVPNALRTSGSQVSEITVTFDHYLTLLNDGLPTTSTVELSGGGGTSKISSLRVNTNYSTGTQIVMSYTTSTSAAANYTETIYFPTGWATFSGTSTNIIKDPVSAAAPFNLRSTTETSLSFDVIRSPVSISSTVPNNNETNVTSTNIILTFDRFIWSQPGLHYYRFATGGNIVASGLLSTTASNTLTTILSYDAMEPLTIYSLSVDAGAFRDDYGNTTTSVNIVFTTGEGSVSDAVFSGTNASGSWTVPPFIRSISALAVSPGGVAGSSDYVSSDGAPGGSLAYKNDITVTPGQRLTWNITNTSTTLTRGGNLVIAAISTGTNVTPIGEAHYYGGRGGIATNSDGGGGGAGGYYGTGGDDGSSSSAGNDDTIGSGGGGGGGGGGGAGGGVGIYGPGLLGLGGSIGGGGGGGSGGTNGSIASTRNGGTFGGGSAAGGNGGKGALRIVWGPGRRFPNTNISSPSS